MITPKVPNRRLNATAALQAAFDEAAETGEPIAMSGTYITNAPLYLHGGHIIGQLTNHSGDWGNTSYTDKGNSVIYNKSLGHAIVATKSGDRCPSIENLAIVCQHSVLSQGLSAAAKKQSENDAAIYVTGTNTALTMRNVIAVNANVGLHLGRYTREHFIDHVTLRSCRRAGIYTPLPTNVPDCRFRDIYIPGSQLPDYVANPPATTIQPIGIDGVPNSSKWHGMTLVESCVTGVRIGVALNQYFADLFIDDSKGVGVELADPYPGVLYSKELTFGRYHYQSAIPNGKMFFGTKTSAPTRVGLFAASVCAAGATLSQSNLKPPVL